MLSWRSLSARSRICEALALMKTGSPSEAQTQMPSLIWSRISERLSGEDIGSRTIVSRFEIGKSNVLSYRTREVAEQSQVAPTRAPDDRSWTDVHETRAAGSHYSYPSL